MPEAPIETVPASLFAGPEDTVVPALTRLRPPRRGRSQSEAIYVVVHRRHGPWTHVYAIGSERRQEAGPEHRPGGGAERLQALGAERRRNRTEVRLLKVLAGDRLGEALGWVERQHGPSGAEPAPRTDDIAFHDIPATTEIPVGLPADHRNRHG